MTRTRERGEIVHDLERDLAEEAGVLRALERDLAAEEQVFHRLEAEFGELRETLGVERAPARPVGRMRMLASALVLVIAAVAGFGIGFLVEQRSTDDLKAELAVAEAKAVGLEALVGASFDETGLYTAYREGSGWPIQAYLAAVADATYDETGLYTRYREGTGW